MERRDFIKKTTAAAGAMAVGFPAIISAQTVTNTLKVGLVGCGGRGTSAAGQALAADPHSELTAMGDIDRAIIEQSAARLRADPNVAGRVKIDRAFVGLDAYEQVITSGIDVVLLATPPAFRPQHLTAAVNAGKHVFSEKPCATDSPGVREVMAAQKLAQAKNLALVGGFCWRYNDMIHEAVQQVRGGAIGRPVSHYSTYYTNPVKPMPPASERPAGMSDIQWQIRNWYNFTWLSGDSLVEQAVHNADKIMWLVNDQPPLSAVAVGGRAVPAHGGNIYDHFEVNYLFPNNYRVFLANRQAANCYNATHDYVMGTEGVLVLGVDKPRIETPDGKVTWQFEGEPYNMYQREQDVLFASIRSGKPRNDDFNLATSTLLAIMGRHAAYSGQQVTWEQALNSEVSLVPKPLDWNGTHDVPGLAVPGQSRVF